MARKLLILLACVGLVALLGTASALAARTDMPVKQDPLVRMPGSQPAPENAIAIEAPTRCTNCHGGFNSAVEPEFNWKGSMMAQAGRDFLYWSCLAVAAQDSIWATGRPNATDICLRCHMGKGWLEGRSDPTNGKLMTGADFDGVQCDFCHNAFDPFFKTTAGGTREGSDWFGYWDEKTTLSSTAATTTFNADAIAAAAVKLFNGTPFFNANAPVSPNYTENAGGQYFMSGTRDKRASFADASARHAMLYSRYHKSKYFCATCHDVSNPVLANLGADPAQPLPTETDSAHSYYHVERTFSEFMLSDYGQLGGADGIGPYKPGVFKTSRPGDKIATCQDCHMRDVTGKAASMNDAVIRPTNSTEHPLSGQPLHDMTGGNIWVSHVLASTVTGATNYNATNAQLLRQGPAVLTLDLTQGLGLDPVALLAGVDRAKQQLNLAAAFTNVSYNPSTGALTFQVQNQTGHKLISGFPEGRRMFVNIKAFASDGSLIKQINPYDSAAGTLKGLPYYTFNSAGSSLPLPVALGPNEEYNDALVYEVHPKSDLTGELHGTFHFALATGRDKDNRIPPKGFRIAEAAARISVPVANGTDAPGLYSAEEYAGGYDQVDLTIPGAAYVELALYYQTTSREYIEFLRDQINGTATTLDTPTPAGEASAYIVQTDPFFSQLKAWGNTIWSLWTNNMNIPGAAPYLMASVTAGSPPPPPPPPCVMPGTPANLTATAGKKKVTLKWAAGSPAPLSGYRIYYLQSGKLQFKAGVSAATTTYTDSGLVSRSQYCYVVTAWNDCNDNGVFDAGIDMVSQATTAVCSTAQ